jgi:hypothetical protein
MRRLFLLLLVCSLSAGCQTLQGYPENPLDAKGDLNALKPYFNPQLLMQYLAETNPSTRLSMRNSIVYGRLAAYDLEFAIFEENISNDKNAIDASGALTVLTLTGLGATVGSAATKAALSAAANGVTGATAVMDKTFFYDKAVPALLTQMHANRATVRANIEAGLLTKSDSQYPLPAALTDLNTYREAGSLPGALEGVTSGAAKVKETATVRLMSLRGLSVK